MKRPIAYAAAILVSAVPAAIGLWGNASFSQAVPVLVPASAQLVTAGTTPDSDSSTSETPSASSSPTAIPSVDDHGGDRPSGTPTTEPGDDHGGNRSPSVPSSSGRPAANDRGGPGSAKPDSSGTSQSGSAGSAQSGRLSGSTGSSGSLSSSGHGSDH